MPFENLLPNKVFHHIYIEDKIKSDPVVSSICARLSYAKTVSVNHYKDVFTPSGQNFLLTKKSPSLILAGKEGRLLYPGAPVCENFGNSHFYYTSLVMNCLYDCEYCYLSGMYPSANLVVFVNIRDIFDEIDRLLNLHPVYLCISYDTDLLALESITGFVKKFIAFTEKRPNLTVECRTKSANVRLLRQYIKEGVKIPKRFIFAWTLSPDSVITAYEHKTPSFRQRLSALKEAADLSLSLRLCFDPVLFIKNWEEEYCTMIDEVFQTLSPSAVKDISIGGFRVSKDSLSKMRKKRENSALLYYPYQLENGVYSYGSEQNKKLTDRLIRQSVKYLDRNKIFVWT